MFVLFYKLFLLISNGLDILKLINILFINVIYNL